jgi:hypothetical protein
MIGYSWLYNPGRVKQHDAVSYRLEKSNSLPKAES